MKIGLLIPHIYAQESVASKTIFAPITLLKSLCRGLISAGHQVTLFSPGPLEIDCKQYHADLKLVEEVASEEGCTLMELVNRSPMAFVSLARQVCAEISAKAFEIANAGELDLLHIFMAEDEIPLYFSNLVKIPVLFTHHDPYNFYRKYRARFPNLKNLNYVSISKFQQSSAPKGLNFVANVYNGVELESFPFNLKPDDYFAYVGRIVRNKGVHLAIEAAKKSKQKLILAGKHYSNLGEKESYWNKYILPQIDEKQIHYVGFLEYPNETSLFMRKAKALLFPIEWEEPFGMVAIEAMASGTPVIAFDKGPMREIIKDGVTGFIVKDAKQMAKAMLRVNELDRVACREHVAANFSAERMVQGYVMVYKKLLN
ncbi:MAG: glycosyltransferase family 4 protein [Candidatus Dojkabacteria bacterium]